MNNTAGAFLELKTFLTGVELTSQKIKANLADGKKSKPFIGIEADNFVNDLEKKVSTIQTKLDIIENNVCGNVETRLSQVTILELYQKCKALYIVNENMISKIEDQMSNYGYISKNTNTTNTSNNNNQNNENAEKTFDNTNIILEDNVTKMRKIDMNNIDVMDSNTSIQQYSNQTEYDDNNDNNNNNNKSIADNFIDRDDNNLNNNFIKIFNITNAANDTHNINNTNSNDVKENFFYDINENFIYTSPQATKHGDPTNECEHDMKTPNLPDWKLSEATRILMFNKDGKDQKEHKDGKKNGNKEINKDKKNGNNANNTNKKDNNETVKSKIKLYSTTEISINSPENKNYNLEGSSPKTPSAMNMSYSYKKNTTNTKYTATSTTTAKKSDLNINTTHIKSNTKNSIEEELLTPKNITSSYNYQLNDNNDSPTTPKLSTPFHTLHLRSNTTILSNVSTPPDEKNKFARTLLLSPLQTDEQDVSLNTINNTNNMSSTNEDLIKNANKNELKPNSINEKIQCINNGVEKHEISILSHEISSNDKADESFDADSNLITKVTHKEWQTAPVFLKKQTTTENVNIAVDNINKYIKEKKSTNTDKNNQNENNDMKLISLSIDEMEFIVKIKAAVLVLVHLKRIDIGSDNGLKIYIIKRK